MTEIELRRIRESDYRPLAEMLDREWKFYIYPQRNGVNLAEYYLFHCLDGANEERVLTVDGRPEGILVIREAGDDVLDFSREMAESFERIRDDPETDRCLRELGVLVDIYNRFAAVHKRPEWAELGLLIVSDRTKGMGLGRRLIAEAESLTKARGRTGLFFYTDTDCNFGFYDHIGAVRVGTEQMICAGELLTVFGYYLDFGHRSPLFSMRTIIYGPYYRKPIVRACPSLY
jgi:GNAT superfamily N-acetyltransferase